MASVQLLKRILPTPRIARHYYTAVL